MLVKIVTMVNIKTLKHCEKLAHCSNELKQHVENTIVKSH